MPVVALTVAANVCDIGFRINLKIRGMNQIIAVFTV